MNDTSTTELNQRKKLDLLRLHKMKIDGEKVVFLTAYDYPLARLADQAGVDMILVGDSLGMTVLGYQTTLPVTMDDMISHCQAVNRAVRTAYVVGDMPYMSYQPSDRDAVINAGRFIAEAGCDAVKCEGGKRVASRVKAMVDGGITVMGHLGLTPQNMGQLGGFRVQGKTFESYKILLEDAIALEEAGASFLLLEAMPPEVAAKIRSQLSIPVYGIGAGSELDGQLVIMHDIIGLFDQFKPKFVKQYCNAGELIKCAITDYCYDVRNKLFPKSEHFYKANDIELSKKLLEA
ncbi:MAG: 3-methyl-2-oxobutanoate hydroxymethyltransferase [Gammaproteobacteria bacterium]